MKKIKSFFAVSAFLTLAALVQGCSNESESTSSTSTSGDQKQEYSGIVPIYTPPSGNTLYVLSAGISNDINKDKTILPNVQFSTEATNGDVGTLEGLLKREKKGTPAVSAITSAVASKAYAGTYVNVAGKHEGLRAVANLGSNAIHLVVKADSDIHSYADLKGKKLGGFAPGVGPRYFVEDLLVDQFGIKPDQYQMIPLSNSDRVDSIKNGSVDGAFLLGTPPSPLVNELARTDDVRVIPIDRAKLEEFTGRNPYYSFVEIKPGTYEGMDESMYIGAIGVMYLTHKETSDEVIYNIIKFMVENPDAIKNIHPAFKITKESIARGTDLPFHNGVKKYLTENGVAMK